jgi:hypothetical protein
MSLARFAIDDRPFRIPARRPRGYVWAAILLVAAALPVAASAQEHLFPQQRGQPEFTSLRHPFYVNAQYFVRQTGYEALWRRYDGHLPTGKGVIIAQCENGLADPAQWPEVEVVHVRDLVDPKWEKHAGTVGQILYGPQPFRDATCVYDRGFSPGVSTVLAFRSNDFRKHV